ncbi:MAG: hypothetical protein KDA24_01270 [Deltaproteobacteria bacterium]|nr:hypothetical protein [Deltaproteobacteria bacterium]
MRPMQLVTLRFDDSRPVAPDLESRLYLARLVSKVCGPFGLLAWRVRGSSLRLLLASEPRGATEAARRVAIGAQQVIGGGSRWAPARVRPIRGVDQVARLSQQLLLTEVTSPLDTASSLPDALGLRALAPYLRGGRALLSQSLPFPPLSDEHSLAQEADWSQLPVAAAAVFGHANLSRRFAWRTRVLSASASLAMPAMRLNEMSALLRVSRSTLYRAIERPVPRGLKTMVEGQLRWRSLLARQERVA